MSTVRLLRVHVAFDAVIDDGTDLAPMDRREAAINAADLDSIPQLVRDHLADVQRQLDEEAKA